MCGLDIGVSGPPLFSGDGVSPTEDRGTAGRAPRWRSVCGGVGLSLSSGCWGAVAHPPPVLWAARRGPRWVGLDVIYPARTVSARFLECKLLGVKRGFPDCCGGCALICWGCASVCGWVHLSVVSATNAHANAMRLQISLLDVLTGRCDSFPPPGGRVRFGACFPGVQSHPRLLACSPSGCEGGGAADWAAGDGAARGAARHTPPPPARGHQLPGILPPGEGGGMGEVRSPAAGVCREGCGGGWGGVKAGVGLTWVGGGCG